jgi:hypothetical protein
MTSIFIAYRREDSADISGRIYDRLVAHYGQRHVFKDVISLEGGQRFPAKLEGAITEQTVMLVIIGQHWLSTLKERESDPYDFGRVEIEIALRQHATIIPLLVQGSAMPSREHLPRSIADLANFHAVNVRSDPDFAADIEKVQHAVGLYLRPASRPVPWAALISVVLLIALSGGLVWHFGIVGQSVHASITPAVTSTGVPLLHCTDAQGNYADWRGDKLQRYDAPRYYVTSELRRRAWRWIALSR